MNITVFKYIGKEGIQGLFFYSGNIKNALKHVCSRRVIYSVGARFKGTGIIQEGCVFDLNYN